MRDNAPAPWAPITVTPQLEVRQPTGETRLFPVVGDTVAAKAMDDRTGDYVLDVTIPGDAPSSDTDWLACTGQSARVRWELVSHGNTSVVWSNRFSLEAWDDTDPGLIRVSAHGVLSRVWDHKNAEARQWRAALARDVLGSIIAVDGVPLRVDPALPKDELPKIWTQGTDRWEAVLDLLEAVSGVLREDEFGAVLAPQPGPVTERPQIVLTNGHAASLDAPATVVSAPRSFDRRDRPNHVVVRGTDAFTEQDFVTEAVEREGPYRPEFYGWVTEEINSDSISRFAQGQLVATNTLAHRRRYRQVITVSMVTDWRIELDDPVEIRKGPTTWWGRVVGVEMPVDGMGVMTVEVGVE